MHALKDYKDFLIDDRDFDEEYTLKLLYKKLDRMQIFFQEQRIRSRAKENAIIIGKAKKEMM